MRNVIKALIVVSTFLAITDSALAQDTAMCAKLESVAKQVMTNRQSGVSLSAMMAVADEAKPAALRKYLRTLTLDAYENPRLLTPAYQTKMINEFGNEAALDCLKSIK